MIIGSGFVENVDGYIRTGCTDIGYMRISISYICAQMNQKDFRKMIRTARFMISADPDLYCEYLNIIEDELLYFRNTYCMDQALLAKTLNKLIIIQKTRKKYGL